MSERQNTRLIRTYMDLIDSQTNVFNNMISAINRQNTNLRDLINNSISYDLSSLNDDINDGTFFRSASTSTSTSNTNNPNRNREQRVDNNNRPISRRPRRIVRRHRPSTGTNTALNTHFPRRTTRPRNLFSNVMLDRQPFTFTTLQSVPIPNRLSPIPTINDVYNSTSTYTYRVSENTSNTDNSDNICPIDRQPYVDGDEIIKINHCGHTFRRRNLLNWFTRQSTCPICRYDIRSNSNTTRTATTSTTQTSTDNPTTWANNTNQTTTTANTTVNFINELSNIISNTMQDVLENSDASNNIVTAEVEFNSSVPFEFTNNINNNNANINNTNINQTDSSNNLLHGGGDFDDIV